jgi:hypothetical protein
MAVLPVVALVTAGFVWWGFTASRRQRDIDRRHRAAFVGFSAALCNQRRDSWIDRRCPTRAPESGSRGVPGRYRHYRNRLNSRHLLCWFIQHRRSARSTSQLLFRDVPDLYV